MYKLVTIQIPCDENLPESFLEFTPEKVLLAINIGYKCVLDAEQSILELTEEMIYNKVKEESKPFMTDEKMLNLMARYNEGEKDIFEKAKIHLVLRDKDLLTIKALK